MFLNHRLLFMVKLVVSLFRVFLFLFLWFLLFLFLFLLLLKMFGSSQNRLSQHGSCCNLIRDNRGCIANIAFLVLIVQIVQTRSCIVYTTMTGGSCCWWLLCMLHVLRHLVLVVVMPSLNTIEPVDGRRWQLSIEHWQCFWSHFIFGRRHIGTRRLCSHRRRTIHIGINHGWWSDSHFFGFSRRCSFNSRCRCWLTRVMIQTRRLRRWRWILIVHVGRRHGRHDRWCM
mmetsp:Transcript_35281/g.57726  ORF Transcript_35281/g.57726 Transcript_35281/m.57726 type:complete len:228 (+) Transcript_35281:371-1054(+)